jgi:hypothetical protein
MGFYVEILFVWPFFKTRSIPNYVETIPYFIIPMGGAIATHSLRNGLQHPSKHGVSDYQRVVCW